MSTYRYKPGRTPLLISIPHAGTKVPVELLDRFTPAAQRLPDTDWHVERLYDFADALGASLLVASHSRYVIDLNRPPDGKDLYPGSRGTELVPLSTFADEPIYRDGRVPDPAETRRRLDAYWVPYHERLAQELLWLRDRHGVAILWDAHSIRSHVPRLFPGRLPDFNLGTNNQASADPSLGRALLALVQDSRRFSAVLNGRFKGGYITRHYGKPAANVHAIQLELAQVTYMDEDDPFAFRPERAAQVAPVIQAMLRQAIAWAERRATTRFAG
jgi:N-formylglutamate deformylase